MYRSIQKMGLVVVAALLWPLMATAQETGPKEFSSEHPLIYEDAWDFWPYSFLNEQGKPEGFNIDMTRTLLKALGIPYEIRLKPTSLVMEDLRSGQADLAMGRMEYTTNDSTVYGRQVISLFTQSVVSPKNHPVSIHTEADLGQHEVYVHKGSFCHLLMRANGWEKNAVPFSDMKEAIQKVSTETEGQIVGNTLTLKWLMNKFQIDNLQLSPVEMSHSEARYMSRNEQLLSQMDSIYARLKADDELQPIFNTWFFPERPDTGIPSWVWLVLGAAVLVALVLGFYQLAYRIRERKMNALIRKRNNRLAIILQTSNVRIWTYDIRTRRFTWMERDGSSSRQYTSDEFAQRYSTDDFARLTEALHQLATQEKDTASLEMEARDDNDSNGEPRLYAIVLSVLRRDNDRPSVIIGTKSDLTEERQKQRRTQSMLLRYQSVFNTAMVDMLYFDQNGVLTEINQKACQTFHLDPQTLRDHHVTLHDLLGIDGLYFESQQIFHTTIIMDRPQQQDATADDEGKAEAKAQRMYYELQLVPVYDSMNELLGIYATGRDVSEMAHAYTQQQADINRLRKATEDLRQYISNINHVLSVGGVRMIDYSPTSHLLTIYSGIDQVQLQLTQTRCISLASEHARKTATRILNMMDACTERNIDTEIATILRVGGLPLVLHFNFIPTYDKQGRLTSYLGMCRDVSEIKATESKLEQETEKAQEVENVKNSFLRNMSYEIRTPLAAVVGFAELFEMPHSSDDETIFIEQIKDNSAHLLHLINDILFLSRLDARMIDIKPQPTDFAKTFESHCQMGWASHQREGVRYIVENHYDQLVVSIDDQNLGHVIEQTIQNAAQHTSSGTVRARYDYVGGQLMIAIDDTGEGISQSTIQRIFERFSTNSQGTGLGLPICRELMKQMGGSININSEQGKGTTVWLMLPCTATVIDRKRQL